MGIVLDLIKMDFSFYALLTVACLVLILAMWACASSDTPKWGPDLTLELPPHVLQEALFGVQSSKKTATSVLFNDTPVVASAPSEKLCDPLLTNEHAMDIRDLSIKTFQPNCKQDMATAVKVLPRYVPTHRLPKPVFSTFKMEQ